MSAFWSRLAILGTSGLAGLSTYRYFVPREYFLTLQHQSGMFFDAKIQERTPFRICSSETMLQLVTKTEIEKLSKAIPSFRPMVDGENTVDKVIQEFQVIAVQKI